MKWFNQLKIQSKLLVIFGQIILVGVAITGWTVIVVNNLSITAKHLVDAEEELSQVLTARNHLKEMEINEVSYVLSQDPAFLYTLEGYRSDIDLYLRNALVRSDSPSIQNTLFEFQTGLNRYDVFLNEIIEAGENQNWSEAQVLGEESEQLFEEMEFKLNSLENTYHQGVDQQVATSQQQVLVSTIIGSISLVVFVGLAFGASTVVNNQIAKPMRTFLKAAEDLRQQKFDMGEMEEFTHRSDEIGRLARSFVEMVQKMRNRQQELQVEIAAAKQAVAAYQASRE